MSEKIILYAKVIMPLKFRDTITYSIPESLMENIAIGSRVEVFLQNKKYIAIVESISDKSDYNTAKVKPIVSVLTTDLVKKETITFWRSISEYYLCSIGEVYKAACPEFFNKIALSSHPAHSAVSEASIKTSAKVKTTSEISPKSTPKITPKQFSLNALTDLQNEALSTIHRLHNEHKTVLLNGVTGSGKTEIYIHLIKETLEKGKNALYLLPEIAISKQLGHRLEKIFGDRLLTYHSGQTIAKRKQVIETISQDCDANSAKVVLGLRSSLFLPFSNLGLIIVDEEHDSSYKQDNPAPRYNGRDAAILLSTIMGANTLLGSATPSFESIYNVRCGKWGEALLQSKFNNSPGTDIEIVDMIKERHKLAIKGELSFKLIKELQNRLDKGEQSIIFRSRRAYSPIVECSECGEIPRCPNCNIHLTYHKFNSRLTCHYCGYSIKLLPTNNRQGQYLEGEGNGQSATSNRQGQHLEGEGIGKCPSCGKESLAPLGAGTERIEEELKELFPTAKIARFDADTTRKKGEQERILKEFAKGKTDILIGTQMITKGFDFENLSFAAVIHAESILSINDFRADERAIQLLEQLEGRVGRRERQGKMLIQTTQPNHPVFQRVEVGAIPTQSGANNSVLSQRGAVDAILSEREQYEYPPFVRLIEITVKDRYKSKMEDTCRLVELAIKASGIVDYIGPTPPPMDKSAGEYISLFRIKLKRDRASEVMKKKLYEVISSLERNIIIDVDPS